jgi:hypothetical protein
MKRFFGLLMLTILLSAGGLYSIGPFTDMDGIITDTTTGLEWTKCSMDNSGTGTLLPYISNCSGTAGQRTWAQAIGDCEALNFAGHSDWRLPNINELLSIMDISKSNPAMDTTCFPSNTVNYFWSSTTTPIYPSSALYVNFNTYGLSASASKSTGTINVRCVR